MNWVEHAFQIVHREIPGGWPRLRAHLEAAPEDVRREFYRVMEQMEQEIRRAKRASFGPLRRH